MDQTHSINSRLENIRLLMRESDIVAYLVPSSDEFLGEYVPPNARRLEYITGFSGSNGFALILMNKVLFFTDGRYLEQVSKELDAEYFEIFDIKNIEYTNWADVVRADVLDADVLAADTVYSDSKNKSSAEVEFSNSSIQTEEIYCGFDPRTVTPRFIAIINKILHSSNIGLKAIPRNLVDQIWTNRPSPPSGTIYDYPIKYAGVGYKDKIVLCQEFLRENKANALIITNPEAVCWLFNIRANDLEFAPILLSYAVITDEKSYLFCDPNRLEKNLYDSRIDDVSITEFKEFGSVVEGLRGVVLYDPNFTSCYVMDLLENRKNLSDYLKLDPRIEGDSTTKVYGTINKPVLDPIQKWKSIKNQTELECIRNSHIEDAVAVIEIISFLSSASTEELENLTEYDVSCMLSNLRSKRKGYVMDSFQSIVGFRENGAIIHYGPHPSLSKELSILDDNLRIKPGMLLIDSGGQYYGATTDITRVILLGAHLLEENGVYLDLVERYKEYYTRVLKGHLSLAMAKFPSAKISGSNLDVLARQYLWDIGYDYPHGTGHGVGSFLSVHEGPFSINLTNQVKIEAGMVMSNEPGYYKSGEFGIRIENMMYTKSLSKDHKNGQEDDANKFLQFEMLTMVPYCNDLINQEMLSPQERAYIKEYYEKITLNVGPLLSNKAKIWLDEISIKFG